VSRAKWQEIANRGLQDNFDPETRAKFDEAVNRGLITVSADQPPAEPEPTAPELTAGGAVLGTANLINKAVTGLGEQAVSGLAGTLFTPSGEGGRVVEAVQEAIPDVPLTQEGQQVFESISQKFNDIAPDRIKELLNTFSTLGQSLGTATTDITGSPALGAVVTALPEALSSVTGLKAARSLSDAKTLQPAQDILTDARATTPDLPTEADQVIAAGERLNVPVLTTDVAPPTSFLGKYTQGLSEKLGPLGSGTSRQTQQIARQNVVEELAKDFGVELESDFAGTIVGSLNAKSARKMQGAMLARNEAVESLNTFGDVPVDQTLAAIDAVLEKQARLGAKADSTIVKNLQDTREAIQGGDFSLVKDIRTDTIDDLIAVGRSEDIRSQGALQSVKSAIDKDMAKFATANDKQAGKKWRAANRNLSEELSLAKETELRRIFKSGEATPEQVLPILLGGKRSQLGRLKSGMGPKGIAAAKSAIIQDALKQSGFLSGNINPDRLATALNKPQMKQAVDVFFSGDSKAEIDGLTKLLEATRRAQQASLAPATGVQNLPLIGAGGVGAGLTVAPLTTIATTTTLSGIAKAYESRGFRDLLLKIGKTKAGSKAETTLLESVAPAVAASLLAAKKEQPEQ